MTLWAQAITDDAQQFGAAWFHYRSAVANKIPEKYQATFKALRAKVMEDQKTITTKQTKIKGYAAEAEGLVKLAAKATMKSGIKAGTGVQRPIAAAQQDARDLAAQMAAELVEVRSPRGLATQPAAISNAIDKMVADLPDGAEPHVTTDRGLHSDARRAPVLSRPSNNVLDGCSHYRQPPGRAPAADSGSKYSTGSPNSRAMTISAATPLLSCQPSSMRT